MLLLREGSSFVSKIYEKKNVVRINLVSNINPLIIISVMTKQRGQFYTPSHDGHYPKLI